LFPPPLSLPFPLFPARNTPVCPSAVAQPAPPACATANNHPPALRNNTQIIAQQGSDGDVLSGSRRNGRADTKRARVARTQADFPGVISLRPVSSLPTNAKVKD